MMRDGIKKSFFNLKKRGLSATVFFAKHGCKRRPSPADSPRLFGLKKGGGGEVEK